MVVQQVGQENLIQQQNCLPGVGSRFM